MTYTGLLDANVIYPAPLRDLLLQLAVTDIFRARWTADIHREWMEALLRNEPHRNRAALERTRDLMDSKTRDCLITGYEALIPLLELPDPNDSPRCSSSNCRPQRCHCDAEPQTFPGSSACPLRHRYSAPRRFLCNHLNLAPGLFCGVVQKIRQRLKTPPYTIEQYLETLTRNGLVATASELRPFAHLL